MNNLSKISTKDLEAEIEKRKEEKEAAAKRRRREEINCIAFFKDKFLQFMSHDRGSCHGSTDNNGFHPEHGGAYCNKCVLENLTGDEDDVEVIFDLRFQKVLED